VLSLSKGFAVIDFLFGAAASDFFAAESEVTRNGKIQTRRTDDFLMAS
jgi:ribosome-associated protein YbcJ (S4-like RNA binding protein)